MQLLGREKFLMDDENPKGKVKFLKGGEFPRNFAPREGDIPRNFAPLGDEIVWRGGEKLLGHRHWGCSQNNFFNPLLS